MQIDVRLDEVVLRALEKEPERRYQQAREMRTQVESIITTPVEQSAKVQSFAQEVPAEDYAIEIGSCLSRGWQLLASDFWPIAGVVALVLLLLYAGVSLVPLALVVGGPLFGGLCLFLLKRIRGEPATSEVAIFCFRTAFVPRFLHLFLTGLLVATLTMVGLMCLLLPGIYFAVAWTFALALAADRQLDCWPAMELSRKTVAKHWWQILKLVLALVAINLAGLLAFGIGVFITAPLTLAALMYAYEDVFGSKKAAPRCKSVADSAADSPCTAGGISAVASDDGIEDARRQVHGPAIGLLITGILNWVVLTGITIGRVSFWYPDHPSHMLGMYHILIVVMAAFLCGIVMILAALKMQRLQAYGLAITASILAILISPSNLIGLPIGIWALVVLSDLSVKRAFEEQTRRRFGGVPPQPTTWHRRFGGVALATFLLTIPVSFSVAMFIRTNWWAVFLMVILLGLAAILLGLVGWKSKLGKTAVIGAGFLLLPVLTLHIAGLVEARMHWWRDSGSQPVPVANALEEYRQTLIGYDLGFNSVFPLKKWTHYDASRLEMYPTKDAWPHVLGHVDTKPNSFKIVWNESQYPSNPIAGPNAFMVPLDQGLVANSTYVTLLFLKGISPKGTVVANTYASLVCIGSMEGRLNFDSYATALLKGDVSGQITSESYFDLVVTGKFSGRILADSYAMIYLMGGCEGSVELKQGAKVYIAGRTTKANLSRVKGQGNVFLEDSDLSPGEHKIGDLNVTVASSNESNTPAPDGAVLKSLLGPWKVVRIEKGDASSSNWGSDGWGYIDSDQLTRVVFDERYFHFQAVKHGDVQTLEWHVNPLAVPKTMDLRTQHSPTEPGELAALGIYEIDGDRLKMCLAKYSPVLQTEQRPNSMAIRPNSGDILLTLERYRPSEDEKALQGTWDVVSQSEDGKAVSQKELKHRYLNVFDVEARFCDGSNQSFPRDIAGGLFVLGPTKQPKTITISGFDFDLIGSPQPNGNGNWKKQQLVGIYKLDGNRLTIAYRKDGARPEKFESTPGSDVTLLVLRKIEPKKAPKDTGTGDVSTMDALAAIRPLDVIQVRVVGTVIDQPIDGFYLVEPDGNVALGPLYGRANVRGLTMEQAEAAIAKQLQKTLTRVDVQVTLARRGATWRKAVFTRSPYGIQPMDVLQVRAAETLLDQPIDGFFLVESGGSIALGPVYGRANVKGLSLEAAENTIKKRLERVLIKPEVQVTLPTVGQGTLPGGQWREVTPPANPYQIGVGDLLFLDAARIAPDTPIRDIICGIYLVEPAGTVALGPLYGRAVVKGLTLKDAEKAIQKKLREVVNKPAVAVTLAGWVDGERTMLPGPRTSPAVSSPAAEKNRFEQRTKKPSENSRPLAHGPSTSGAVLVYEMDPSSASAGSPAPDMDKLLNVIDLRLNAGVEKLAQVRKLDDRRIEVALLRPSDADRKRVERLLARPGTLEFRILASSKQHKALMERVNKEPGKAEFLDEAGQRLAWWVPMREGKERSIHDFIVARFKKKQNDREVMEVLVVADPYNVTGAYLTKAEAQRDHRGQPCIGFTLNDAGGKRFAQLTGDHLPDAATNFTYKLGIILDGELWSAPSIQSVIHNQGQITGTFTKQEAAEIADVLNAGSLPACQLKLQSTRQTQHESSQRVDSMNQ
ncbi:MAG: polysaccharide biosynthesis/export family protein [Thermoguttaceae bacterium]